VATGASGEIGTTYADRLARRGYDLVLVACSPNKLAEVAKRVAVATGRSVQTVAADLNNKADLKRVETLLATDPEITMLANNAGVGALVSLLESNVDEGAHRCGIQRGMRVLELGCGAGDVSLWIADLVGPSGLVVGVDDSAERIDLAQKRATVAGQCYWTRFVTADLNTFIPHGRYDVVVARRALPLQREPATFLRLSTWLRPDGVVILMVGKPAGSNDNRSLI
jgi:2-polyprenyl-3-methyl-5-hydroxy-6-metoxy-1,4-benzoquinol methylase